MKARVLGRRDVLALHDQKSGEAVGRYTTKTVRQQERRALADAATIASGFRQTRERRRKSRHAAEPATPP